MKNISMSHTGETDIRVGNRGTCSLLSTALLDRCGMEMLQLPRSHPLKIDIRSRNGAQALEDGKGDVLTKEL